jgi:hypothetical protein
MLPMLERGFDATLTANRSGRTSRDKPRRRLADRNDSPSELAQKLRFFSMAVIGGRMNRI